MSSKKFMTWGTDGCTACETGRIILFVANKKCITCDPESYIPPCPVDQATELKYTYHIRDDNHTTHFNDCGCASKVKDKKIASLQKEIERMKKSLEMYMSENKTWSVTVDMERKEILKLKVAMECATGVLTKMTSNSLVREALSKIQEILGASDEGE